VREVLKNSCDKIDVAGGAYDAAGHSALYGYGRLNARKAVELALPTQPPQTHVVTASAKKDVAIKDFKTATLALSVAETAPLKSIIVEVDIEHTYIGDLLVTLTPPPALKLPPVLLHNNAGGGEDNLRAKYDGVNTAALKTLTGKSPAGTWTLVVKDTARGDVGRIRALTLTMTV
jgi:subtilisin-like proprotein convertase family protein